MKGVLYDVACNHSSPQSFNTSQFKMSFIDEFCKEKQAEFFAQLALFI